MAVEMLHFYWFLIIFCICEFVSYGTVINFSSKIISNPKVYTELSSNPRVNNSELSKPSNALQNWKTSKLSKPSNVLQNWKTSRLSNTSKPLRKWNISKVTSNYIPIVTDMMMGEKEGCIEKTFDEICLPESQLLKYYLYTRTTADQPFEINFNNIEEATFSPSVPLKVLIHGYTGSKDYSPNMQLRPAFFKKGDYNLLSIDWSLLSKEGCYFEATNNVQPTGKCVARLLEKIVSVREDVNPEDIHVIGFSLGAQVAGSVGRSLKDFRAKRITGLDPALPLFDSVFNSAYSLGKKDARFVDVIHSNGGMKGKSVDIGHVDFHANGGSIQPGCERTNTSCHHVRAVEIYAESIYSDVGFYGYGCESLMYYMTDCCVDGVRDWVRLGEYVDEASRGTYYFDTSDKYPLALGMNCIP